MGMRMMFTVFLLVVLATTVVSDRASNRENRRASNWNTRIAYIGCCDIPDCYNKNREQCLDESSG
uniref:Alpha conotoxin Im1.95 n=1 Tax=Conus imperialis TaxID=35631 RepID=D9IXB4_CONIM|nr:alpha conotoxin Im1.95 precursor [Conus imperialis]